MVPWGRNTRCLGSVSGGETRALLLLAPCLPGRESPGWHGSKHSPPHSTGSLGKMYVSRKCQVCFIYPNYYVKMILSVVKAAETVPESLVPWQELPWCRWHVMARALAAPCLGTYWCCLDGGCCLSHAAWEDDRQLGCRDRLAPAPPLTFPISLWKLLLSIF